MGALEEDNSTPTENIEGERSTTQVTSRNTFKLTEESAEAEYELYSSLISKGPLDDRIQLLYKRACFGYVEILFKEKLLDSLRVSEDALWRLHLLLIKEFRRRIKDSKPSDSECLDQFSEQINVLLRGFQKFLQESTTLYSNIILDLKKIYGMLEDSSVTVGSFLHGKGATDKSFRLLYHRFLINLGDLARYMESFPRSLHNWSTAARYYFDASLVYPANGNPYNQMAVLAGYIGDDFLALYYWFRGVAVEEPCECARKNLSLFLDKETIKTFQSGEENFMTIFGCHFIQMIGVFYASNSNLEDVFDAYTSALVRLEKLLSADDEKLAALMQQVKQLTEESPRKIRAFRVLQLVVILICIVIEVCRRFKFQKSKERVAQQKVWIQQAWTTAFAFMVHILNRCEASNSITTPLLTGVLVFVEWFAQLEDLSAITNEASEKCAGAANGFCESFATLLNKLGNEQVVASQPMDMFKASSGLLWEDIELQGFLPVMPRWKAEIVVHNSVNDLDAEKEHQIRTSRIFAAGMKIVNIRRGANMKWLQYNARERKFYADCNSQIDQQALQSGEVSKPVLPGPEPQNSNEVLTTEKHATRNPSIAEGEVIVFDPALVTKNFRRKVVRSEDLKSPPPSVYGAVGSSLKKERVAEPGIHLNDRAASPLFRKSELQNPKNASFAGDVKSKDEDSPKFISPADIKMEKVADDILHYNKYTDDAAGLNAKTTQPSLQGWVLEKDKGPLTIDKLPTSYVPNRMKGIPPLGFSNLTLNTLPPCKPEMNSGYLSSNNGYTQPLLPTQDVMHGLRSVSGASDYTPMPYTPKTPSAPLLLDDNHAAAYRTPTSFHYGEQNFMMGMQENMQSPSASDSLTDKIRTPGFIRPSNMSEFMPLSPSAFNPGCGMLENEFLASKNSGCQLSALPAMYRLHQYKDALTSRQVEAMYWHNPSTSDPFKDANLCRLTGGYDRWVNPSGPMFVNLHEGPYQGIGIPLPYGYQRAVPMRYGIGLDQRADQLVSLQRFKEQECLGRHISNLLYN